MPYPDAFSSIVVPPAKQALKFPLVTLTLLAAPPTSSTCSCTYTANAAPVGNTRASLYTTSVASKASANKYRKLSTPLPLGLPKPS